MPLKSAGADPREGADTRLPIVLDMVDPTGRTMTVFVSDMALEKLEPKATDGYMAVFLRRRAAIEKVASRKFDLGVAGSRLTIMSSDV